MVLGISHNDDDTFVVIVSLAGEPSAEGRGSVDRLINVLDGDVEMDADLPVFWLQNRLEYQPRHGIATVAEVYPAVLRRGSSRPSRALQNRATRSVSRQSMVTPDHTLVMSRSYT